MSRLDLDQIQSQLKTAIQNHQILVSRIQLQPQDMGLKSQLHNLQKEIMLMSKKQKLIVQKLRKELLERESTPQSQTEQKNQPTPPQSQPESKAVVTMPIAASKPVIPSLPLPTKSCDVPKKPSSVKSSTPPLRVPQYPGNRANVLQNNNSLKPNEEQSVILNRKPDKSISSPKEPNKERELKRKLDFMACIDLVTKDSLKDLQGKRSERKRRSTNNPNFAYGFELERRPRLSNFLGNEYFGAKRPKGRPSTLKSEAPSPTNSRPTTPVNGYTSHSNSKENNVHDNLCSVCLTSGQLLLCDTCSSVYHLQCLSPPLTTVPDGHWSCHKCQEASTKSALSLAAVNKYIANKTGKEDDKRKLLKRSAELLQEKTQLENRTKQLNEILARQGVRKQDLIEINKKAQQSVENLKSFVKAVKSS